MFLAVTPLEEFWDKNDELLFIGPWCALHERRPEWERLRPRFLADPWSDLARFQAAASYCRDVSSHLLDQLVPYLNGTLGIIRSRRAWRILLDPWLTYHVEQMYDHCVHVEDALKLEPSLRTFRLDPACDQTPRSTADFMRLTAGHFFHLQMFSHILAAKMPDSPVRALSEPTAPQPRPGFKRRAKRALTWALTACARAGAGEILISELGLSRGERLRLILGSRFKTLPYLAELPDSPAPIPDERRQGLRRLQARDEFERIFINALPHHLPTLFLEGYADAVNFTRSHLGRTPRAAFTTVDCHYADSFKFAAAECVERGAELWGCQHGGSYGMMDYSPAEDFERSVSDRYYCWGWSKTERDLKLRDLPPPMLSRNGATRSGDEVLYVSTPLDLHNVRLIRANNNTLAFDYLNRQSRLLRALPEPARSRTRLRLYRRDWGWKHRERIQELCPDTRFDDPESPFAHRLREVRLAVFDCPSTPLLEAMAADIPSVLSWREDAWPLRDAARPFVEALKTVRILFDSPEEAAAQVGLIYADPRAWWDEPERRAAHRTFARNFARSSPDWLDAWLKEVREEPSTR